MAEQDFNNTQNTDETSKDKRGNTFNKIFSAATIIGKKAVEGASFVADKINKGAEIIKDKIDDVAAEKELQKKIEQQFNAMAIKYSAIIPGEKTKRISVLLQTNYDKKTLSLYGENKAISNNCYFIDSTNQKFTIQLIRQGQTTEITVNGTAYVKPITVFEYAITNDDETKKEMQTIINNISITDSTITKSNIGNN